MRPALTFFTTEQEAKRLCLLHEIIPPGLLILHLVNPNYPPTAVNVKEVDAAARSIGRQILLLGTHNEFEIDAAFSTFSLRRAAAIIAGADPIR